MALRAASNREGSKTPNFSKTLATAEAFLKASHPEALVPHSVIKENLYESSRLTVNDHLNGAQGDLLALGIVKQSRVGGKGKRLKGPWKRLCLVFASGTLRTNVGKDYSIDPRLNI